MARLSLAHSPDADDAFMFWALETGRVAAEGIEFRDERADIETLNRRAREGVYDVTAVSIHAYGHVADRYRLLTCGASVGDGYGPVVVSNRPMAPSDLEDATVAVPGEWTTAFLALKIRQPAVRTKVLPFDSIMDSVLRGDVDAGVLIHEGQLTYADRGLHRVEDLGAWWTMGTGLPLPLGGVAVRRDIPDDVAVTVGVAIRESIQYALDRRAEAMAHARRFARGIEDSLVDHFIHRYVNSWSLDLGPRGEEAVVHILGLGHEMGLLPRRVRPEFVGF